MIMEAHECYLVIVFFDRVHICYANTHGEGHDLLKVFSTSLVSTAVLYDCDGGMLACFKG